MGMISLSELHLSDSFIYDVFSENVMRQRGEGH